MSDLAGDSYLPARGNGGYGVDTLRARPALPRVDQPARAAPRRSTRPSTQALERFSLDLVAAAGEQGDASRGARGTRFEQTARKLIDHAGRGDRRPTPSSPSTHRLRGRARAVVEPLGHRSAGRSSTTACSSRPSPREPRPGSPATTRSPTRRATTSGSPPSRPTPSSATARSSTTASAAGHGHWHYVQTEPTATYLATVQIGRYALAAPTFDGVPGVHRVPARDRGRGCDGLRAGRPDDGALRAIASARIRSTSYTVVVTADDARDPARGAGARHLRRQPRRRPRRLGAAHRPRARPPVVRQQRRARALEGHLAQRGLRLLLRVALVRAARAARRPTRSRGSTAAASPHSRGTSCSATRGPR